MLDVGVDKDEEKDVRQRRKMKKNVKTMKVSQAQEA